MPFQNFKRISNGLSQRDCPTSKEEFIAWAERLSKWQAGGWTMLSTGNRKGIDSTNVEKKKGLWNFFGPQCFVTDKSAIWRIGSIRNGFTKRRPTTDQAREQQLESRVRSKKVSKLKMAQITSSGRRKKELVMHVVQRSRLSIDRRVVKDKQDQKKQITPKRCVTW
ncbi:hypothetical protein DFJ73DRAFT_757175 [Zopfochytrium polystomum]|nr:hypothetical protein DFJ73DRAFT_757175 [Zopfochytrium polystomum]